MAKLTQSTLNFKENNKFLLVARKLGFEELAWTSGFYRRKPKKITATAFMLSFWLSQATAKASLREWAISLGLWTNQEVDKESINGRLTDRAVELSKAVLERALLSKMEKNKLRRAKARLGHVLSIFNRVIVRDSTTFNLPNNLNKEFTGNYSHGKQTAVMRTQAHFDLTNEWWLSFKVGSYTDNDQGAAACIADDLEPRDLVLQDLGYFTLAWIAQLVVNQYLITKWDNKTHLFDCEEKRLDPERIMELLKDGEELDMPVLLGAKKKIPMRMVLRKLPKGEANKRKEKAKKDRHSKTNHSDAYYEMLQYEIYLTNIPKELVTGYQIAKLYELRWHIEILFKSWKSYDNMAKMFEVRSMNAQRAWFTIYAMLAKFTFITNEIQTYVNNHKIFEEKHKLSVQTFVGVVNKCLESILRIEFIEQMDHLVKQFRKHATYKKHTKRTNLADKYLNFTKIHI